MSYRDLSGETFGRWLVIGEGSPIQTGRATVRTWHCRCACGVTRDVRELSLLQGTSKSCGCYHKDVMKVVGKSNTKHGMSYSRLYRIYNHMHRRCSDKHDVRYDYYGGRGISVCEEWQTFAGFRDWALSHGYSDELSIDRIDVNKDYSPENCRWSTVGEQANNKTSTILLEFHGQVNSLANWAKELGMPYSKLWKRIHNGWDVERAFST